MMYHVCWHKCCYESIYILLQGGQNAFHLCAMAGHLTVAKYLAPKMHGDLFDTTDNGNTALHYAVHRGRLPMVQYLVRSCGFIVTARNKVGLLYVCATELMC